MSYVRCGECTLIIEASPRPPSWRCPNCQAVNRTLPMPGCDTAARKLGVHSASSEVSSPGQ